MSHFFPFPHLYKAFCFVYTFFVKKNVFINKGGYQILFAKYFCNSIATESPLYLSLCLCVVLSVYAAVGTKWNQIELRPPAAGPGSSSRTLFNYFLLCSLFIISSLLPGWLGWAAVHCVSSSAINSFSC